MPYLLRVFTPEKGTREITVKEGSNIIGNSNHCDIQFEHKTINKEHAQLIINGSDIHISPSGPTCSVVINGKVIDEGKTELHLGDNIQVGLYDMELISNQSLRSPDAFRSRFDFLPQQMKIKARSYDVIPEQVFETGDTMIIGKGGILLPSSVNLSKEKVHELNFIWPTGQTRIFFSEVMGDIKIDGNNFTCVKLHKIDNFKFKKLNDFSRDSWRQVQ